MKINHDPDRDYTCYQVGAAYSPQTDLKTDFVIPATTTDLRNRIEGWKAHGYRNVQYMIGVNYGAFGPFLDGVYDGRNHWDEAQLDKDGAYLTFPYDIRKPYMVPTIAFTEFLTAEICKAIDIGIDCIHLQEPEFWVMAGYSPAFKREWDIYYKEPWQPPHKSVDAQYKASKLKQYLYTRVLDHLCAKLKEYAKVKYGRDLRFYVPSHSLINYTQWRIVSPESMLLDAPTIDGFIAQVWTGPSRTPNVYEGVTAERPFETSYLEYGIMQELVRGSGRELWLLHDPIEDNPRYTWKNYRQCYKQLVASSLLQPKVYRYEVCPWPNRIFCGSYPSEDGAKMENIPADYATILCTVFQALGDMKQPYRWISNNTEIGLLLSDTAMYQRRYPHWTNDQKYDGTQSDKPIDPELLEILKWSPFFGLALPLLKYGNPVRPVQLENVTRYAGYLDEYKILVLSYEYMKPSTPAINNVLAQWVRDGGALVYAGDGSDEFHSVREWWNTGAAAYDNPAQHLFRCLGLHKEPDEGIHRVGAGLLQYLRRHPASFARSRLDANVLRGAVKQAAQALGGINVSPCNCFILERGPYTIAAVMRDAPGGALRLDGIYVDLFTAGLAVVNGIKIEPGDQAVLVNLEKLEAFEIAATSLKAERLVQDGEGFTFCGSGPSDMRAAIRIKCPRRVETATARTTDGKPLELAYAWDGLAGTVLLRIASIPEGVVIRCIYALC